MNQFLLLPFSYFYSTRLSKGSLAFHALFEWVAAAWLVAWLYAGSITDGLVSMLLSYLAFISLYELGYFVNDFHASRYEEGGRRRGPQDLSPTWIVAWIATRLLAFVCATVLLGQQLQAGWWSFFAALTVVFALHNGLQDSEMKTVTFSWLAWFRFMAPVIFVVQEDQLMGIGLAAAMGYVAFRQLGYMDSKRLLAMPGRQRGTFRVFFFFMPIVGIASLWPYAQAKGYMLLVGYWALIAAAGTIMVEKLSSVRISRASSPK